MIRRSEKKMYVCILVIAMKPVNFIKFIFNPMLKKKKNKKKKGKKISVKKLKHTINIRYTSNYKTYLVSTHPGIWIHDYSVQ